MASQNNTAYTLATSVGLFGGGLTSAGTGNDAGGLGLGMADSNFQVPFTATAASPGVFTVNAAFTPYLTNTSSTAGNQVGTIVTVGFASAAVPYTVTSASPAVFTSVDLGTQAYLNDLVGATTDVTLIQNGTPVVLYGAVLGGFTASVPWGGSGGAYSPSSGMTVYYMVNVSSNTFQLSATLGGSAINSTGTAISAYTGQSLVQVVGGAYASSNIATQTPYYMVGVSSNTFQLALTPGGSAINTNSAAAGFAGILQFDLVNQQVSSTVGANQVPYGTGTGTTYQGYRKNGFRYGIQDAYVSSASSLSLDENPQLAWQNVPGSTCQNGQSNSIQVGGSNYGTQPDGWGAAGGFVSGQPVYEVKEPTLHVNETNGKSETTQERRVRLSNELDGLKAKASLTAKEQERQAVVEAALKELKE